MRAEEGKGRFQEFIDWLIGRAETAGPKRFDDRKQRLADRITEIMDLAEQRVRMTRQTEHQVEIELCDETEAVAEDRIGLLKYLRGASPRCIAGLNVRAVTVKNAGWDGHASPPDDVATEARGRIEGARPIDVVFWLVCTCGCESHFVLGHYWRNHWDRQIFVSPLAVRCSACAKISDVFDSDIHGYDAQIGAIPTNYRGTGERSEFACHRCGPRPFQVFARFEYPDDLLQQRTDQFRGREQELFTWFTLLGKCTACGCFAKIADCECA